MPRGAFKINLVYAQSDSFIVTGNELPRLIADHTHREAFNSEVLLA